MIVPSNEDLGNLLGGEFEDIEPIAESKQELNNIEVPSNEELGNLLGGEFEDIDTNPVHYNIFTGADAEQKNKFLGEYAKTLPREKQLDFAQKFSSGQLQQSLETYRDVPSDEAFQIDQIAKEGKYSFPQILTQEGLVQKKKNIKTITDDIMSKNADGHFNNPLTVQYMNNPVNAAKNRDNYKNLLEAEQIIARNYDPVSFKRLFHDLQDASGSVIRGALGTLQSYKDLFTDPAITSIQPIKDEADSSQGGQALSNLTTQINKLAQPNVGAVKADQKQLDDYVEQKKVSAEIRGVEYNVDRKQEEKNFISETKLAKEYEENFMEALKPIPDEYTDGFNKFATEFIGITPQIVASMGLSAIHPLAGASFMWQLIYGGTYLEHTEQGIDPLNAARAAGFNASLQAPLEYIGLTKVMKMFKTTGAADVLKNWGSAMITEFGTEFLQSYVEEIANIPLDKEATTGKQQLLNFIDRLPETTKQGIREGLLVSVFSLLGGAVKLPTQIRIGQQKAIDKRNYKVYDELNTKLSELDQGDKEKTAEFIEAASIKKGISTKQFYKFSEMVDAFGGEKKAIKALEKLGALELYKNNKIQDGTIELDIPSQLRLEEKEGGAIEISAPKWGELYAGTDESVVLRNKLRFEEDGLTSEESAQVETDLKRQAQDETKAQEASSNLLEFFKKTDTGRVIYNTTEHQTIAEAVADVKQPLWTPEYANDIKTKAGYGTWDNSQLNINGFNIETESESTEDLITLSESADITTLIEERTELSLKKKYKVNETGEFIDPVMNQATKDTRARMAIQHNYTTSESDIEFASTLAIDYFNSENPETFWGVNSFTKEFKKVLDQLRDYFKQLIKNVGIYTKARESGAINDDMHNAIKDAIKGDFAPLQKSDDFTKADKELQTIKDDVTIPLVDDSQVTDKLNFQIQPTEKQVWDAVNNYNKLIKIHSTFRNFNSQEKQQESQALLDQNLNVISRMTGLETPSDTTNKAETDSYIREVKTFLNEAKRGREELPTVDITTADLNIALDNLKSQYKNISKGIKNPVVKRDTVKKEVSPDVDRALTNVSRIQTHIETLINSMPIETQGRAKSWITRTANAYKNNQNINTYINNSIKSFDKIIEKYEAYQLVADMNKLTKQFDAKKDFTGRLISRRLNPEEQRTIGNAKKYLWETGPQIEKKIADLSNKLQNGLTEEDIKAGDTEAEVVNDLNLLMTFGHIIDKKPNEIRYAFNELSRMIEKGLAKRDILNQEFKAKIDSQKAKVLSAMTGGKGIKTGLEADELKRKQANYWFKLAKAPVEFYERATLSFEYQMNALARKEIDSPHLKSSLNEFSNRVEDATFKKDTEIFNRTQDFQDAIKSIYKADTQRQLNKYIKENSKVVDNKVKVKDIVYKKYSISLKEAQNILNTRNQTTGELSFHGKKLAPRMDDLITNKVITAKYFAEERGRPNIIVDFDIEIVDSTGKKRNLGMTQFEAIQYSMMAEQNSILDNMFYHGWDDASLNQLYDFLTPESIKIKEYMQSEYEKQYSPMNDVYKKLFNIDMPKVDNYARAKFEFDKSNADTGSIETLLSGGRVASSAVGVNVISRVKHNRELEKTSAIDLFSQSIAESAHFKAFGELAKELKSVFKSEEIRVAIKQEFGANKVKDLTTTLDDIINGGIDNQLISRAADKIRSAITKYTLSFKLPNLFKQVASHPAYAMGMPIKDYFKFTKEFFENPTQNWKEIRHSEFIEQRLKEGFSKDMQNALKSSIGKPPTYVSDMFNYGMLPTKYGDIIPIIPGYYAKYRSHYEQNVTDNMTTKEKTELKAESFDEARRLTKRFQQSGGVNDLSIFGRKGSIAKLGQMYISSNRSYTSGLIESMRDAIVKKPGAKELAMKQLAVNLVLANLYQAVGDGYKYAASWGEDTPDWEDYLLASVLFPLKGIVIARDVVTYLARKTLGLYTDFSITQVEDVIEQALDIAINTISGNFEKAFKNLYSSSGAYQTVKPAVNKKRKKKFKF